jgi:hypothetical protein
MKKFLIFLTLGLLFTFVGLNSCKGDDDVTDSTFKLHALNGHWKKGDSHYRFFEISSLNINDLPTDAGTVTHQYTSNSPLGLPDQEWEEKGEVVINDLERIGTALIISGNFEYTSRKLKVLGTLTTGDPETKAFTAVYEGDSTLIINNELYWWQE